MSAPRQPVIAFVPGPNGVVIVHDPKRTTYGPARVKLMVVRPERPYHLYCDPTDQGAGWGDFSYEVLGSGALKVSNGDETLMIYAPGAWSAVQPWMPGEGSDVQLF